MVQTDVTASVLAHPFQKGHMGEIPEEFKQHHHLGPALSHSVEKPVLWVIPNTAILEDYHSTRPLAAHENRPLQEDAHPGQKKRLGKEQPDPHAEPELPSLLDFPQAYSSLYSFLLMFAVWIRAHTANLASTLLSSQDDLDLQASLPPPSSANISAMCQHS